MRDGLGTIHTGLKKPEHDTVQKNKGPIKLGQVIAEILVICTNVGRTYVSWKNLIMTVGIC